MCGQRSQDGLQAGFDPGGQDEATRQIDLDIRADVIEN
jgi:hypothetical protein